MSDIVDKKTRSRMMASVKSKDTQPELMLRRSLHQRGFRYRLHDKALPGKPDLVFPKYKAIVFVHGCFWHGHTNCRYASVPTTHSVFWEQKIHGNIERDARNLAELRGRGWRTAVIWECALRTASRTSSIELLVSWLLSASADLELPNSNRP